LQRPGPGTATRTPATPADVLAFVAIGMDAESREVFDLVRSKREEIAEEQDAEAE
jgi:hypothetical protein